MPFLIDFIDHLNFLLRKWQLKRNDRMVVIRGSCNMCGDCCRGISLNVDGNWMKWKWQFTKAQKKHPYLTRFRILGKTESGHLQFACTCLTENGTCSDYTNRPELCKRFPSPTIYMENGYLPDGCGFRMSTETDFEKILEQAVLGDVDFKVTKPSSPKKPL